MNAFLPRVRNEAYENESNKENTGFFYKETVNRRHIFEIRFKSFMKA